MKVYLVQHGEAKAEAEDPRRPVTLKGELEVRRMARVTKTLGVRPQRIYHSGKLRAKQTAEIIGEILEMAASSVEAAQGLNPNDEISPWAERIQEETKDLMLVGHLPFLEKLASHMLCENESARLVLFCPAAILCLDQKENRGWAVRWILTPEMFEVSRLSR